MRFPSKLLSFPDVARAASPSAPSSLPYKRRRAPLEPPEETFAIPTPRSELVYSPPGARPPLFRPSQRRLGWEGGSAASVLFLPGAKTKFNKMNWREPFVCKRELSSPAVKALEEGPIPGYGCEPPRPFPSFRHPSGSASPAEDRDSSGRKQRSKMVGILSSRLGMRER